MKINVAGKQLFRGRERHAEPRFVGTCRLCQVFVFVFVFVCFLIFKTNEYIIKLLTRKIMS